MQDVPVYLALVGSLELGALLVAAAVGLVGARRWGWSWYRLKLGRSAVFAVILLGVGCIGNSVFMLVAYDRLYISADTVVDFFPFIPFGQWVLDRKFGQYHGGLLDGASLSEVQLIWAVVAAAVWCATFLVYRAVAHRMWPRRVESAGA